MKLASKDSMEKKYTSSNKYPCFQENTCYSFNNGFVASIGFYRDKGYEILEWSDYMKKQFTKANLKADIVKYWNRWKSQLKKSQN